MNVTDTQAPSLEPLRAGYLALLPRIEAAARLHARHIRCPGRRDDLVAEALALGWAWYLRLARREKNVNEFPCTFAMLAARHARSGRRVCGQEKAKDAMSARAQRIHGFTAQRLPERDTGGRGDALADALCDNTRTPPPDAAAFRCDFPRFMESLGERKRLLAEDLMVGERTQDVAVKHGVSQARVSQVRRELLLSWRRFHNESVA